MKKLLLIVCALALPLSACATIPTSPAAVANTTKADEQAINTAELAYKSWRLAVETGVNAGQIKGQLATRVAQLDNQLYSALQTLEHVYEGGNAADITTALANFNVALTNAYTTIGGR